MGAIVRSFANDVQTQAVLVLVVLDLILGIVSSVKLGEFAFTKVSGFLKDDVLSKVLPWFAIYAAWKYAPSVDVLGVGLEQVQQAVFAGVVIALIASLTSSLADLGLSMPKSLATGENEGSTPKPSG